MESNDFELLIRDAAQSLSDWDPITTTLLERIYSESARILWRNSYEAIIADTRNRIVQLFRDWNIEFYIPAPWRRKKRETPEQWIERVIEPLVHDDMKQDQWNGKPIYRLKWVLT